MEYQEGSLIIDGIKIHYYRSGGRKPAIVLLHGGTDDGLCWGRTARELAEQFDVIMPDAQGHGFSDRLDAEFSFDNHTKHVAGLVKELGLEKPVIMGHSMGAGITCSVAMEYPDLPKAIILEDPSWGLFPPKPEDFETAKKNHEAIRAYQTGLANVPLEQAIHGYTLGGAIAAKREKTEGSIEVGKLADVIIISQDLFKVEPNQIGKTKVLITMVGGKVVYKDPSWESEPSADLR
ncbi:MAG: alpha/beta fold hydrolase [Acidobacteriota bacterium]